MIVPVVMLVKVVWSTITVLLVVKVAGAIAFGVIVLALGFVPLTMPITLAKTQIRRTPRGRSNRESCVASFANQISLSN